MSADLATTLALLKVGDEVVVTVEDPGPQGTYSITGIVWEENRCLYVAGKRLRYPDGNKGWWIKDVVINKPAPDPEPPIGSVVLDQDGDAWQRTVGDQSGGSWWASWPYPSEITWDRLSKAAGPLRVIYAPEGES